MLKEVVEQRIAEDYVARGIDVEDVKAHLIAYNNQVNFDGKVHKVYGARLLAIMYSLKDKPTVDSIPAL